MRLIDADAICHEIARKRNNGELDFSPKTELMIIDVIQEQPTAYDPDKVVEQINAIGMSLCKNVKCDIECCDCDHGCMMRAIVKKVKGGGIDENN